MKHWHRWLLGAALLVVFVIWQAPAGLVSRVTEGTDVRLLQAAGTLWSGEADLLVQGFPVGRLSWRWRPGALLGGRVGIEWALNAPGYRLHGNAAAAPSTLALNAVRGTVEEPALRRVLAAYDIVPSGNLTINTLDVPELTLDNAGNLLTISASGQLTWSGGPVTYRLSGVTRTVDLPPLEGALSTPADWPELLVTERGTELPLITGRLTERNSVAVGITSGFTKLVGQPWPGSEPDHAVVLEVEEMLN